METYYYGQGKISLAELDSANVPGEFIWVGDVSAFTSKFSGDKVQHKESFSGMKGLAKSFPVGSGLDIDMTMHSFSPADLARALRSTVVTTAASTFTAEAFPADLVAGDVVRLANQGVSDLVITDSAGTPATLTLGTDYTADLNFGVVALLNVTGYTQPFKAAGSNLKRTAVGMLTKGQKYYALKYEGYNLAESNSPVIVDVYKLAPDIIQELALITTGTDVAGMAITGAGLIDTTKAASADLGQFGSITQIGV